MRTKDNPVNDKASELLEKFGSKEIANLCIDEIISELQESFVVAKDLHPHAIGLISGALFFWEEVKSNLCAR